jgi:hypothetical protein
MCSVVLFIIMHIDPSLLMTSVTCFRVISTYVLTTYAAARPEWNTERIADNADRVDQRQKWLAGK